MANVYASQAQTKALLEEEAPEVLETVPSRRTFPGQDFPLGVSEVDGGINFAIFSQNATAVTLCLSLSDGDALAGSDGMVEVALDPQVNKTGDIWHICIEKDLVIYEMNVRAFTE